MERIKRPHTDTILDCNNNIIKKPKLDDISEVTINTKGSLFEDLANEILYEIFDYLDIHHAYYAFFNLNKRFQNLFLHSNLPIQVNISTMSKSSFERYHKNVIIPNKHRINYLRLSNPFTVDIIFSPPVTISKFIQLETLVLDNINAKYLRNIFTHAILLPKLHSLVLSLADLVQDASKLFTWILRLPKLKFCKITYETKNDGNLQPLLLNECSVSPIEYLVINTRFLCGSLDHLLFRVPNLRHLSINYLIGYLNLDTNPSFIELKQLKNLSLKLEIVFFEQLQMLITNCFHHVEVLRLTTRYDPTYLDAQRWKEFIVSSMPNLRIFDINYDGGAQNNSMLYHDFINAFNSPFWTQRGWFFTHQHTWRSSLDSGMFYSTDPYRRKDYTFYCELAGQICSHRQETNLNSVEHVHIGSTQLTDNPVNYFPNTTELTIEHYFETPDDSIVTTLNRIVPLQQLTKLAFQSLDFPFEQIIHLVRYTPNLHTLVLNSIYVQKNSFKFIKQSDTFQYVSKANKIKNVEIHQSCNSEQIQLIVNIFPRMEYFKIRMFRSEIEHIVEYILAKRDNQTPHLFFLRVSGIPKICFNEVDRLIKREQLLKDYSIKFLNHDLYLWW